MENINNVLIIDDEPLMNMINEKIIQKANFAPKVSSYLQASKALEELKELVESGNGSFPEYIFIDVNMPEMDGWAFLEEFQKFPEYILTRCKVIMLSASVSYNDLEKTKPYKMVRDFISKPLSVAKLQTLFAPATAAVA